MGVVKFFCACYGRNRIILPPQPVASSYAYDFSYLQVETVYAGLSNTDSVIAGIIIIIAKNYRVQQLL